MNYLKNYLILIESRKNKRRSELKENKIYEKHHILPKSLGGSNRKENIILLTPREHFIAHYMLMKIYEPFGGKEYRNMVFAFLLMNKFDKNKNRYFNSRLYEANRKEIINQISFLNKGRKHNKEVNKKKGEKNKGKKWFHKFHTLEEKFDFIENVDLNEWSEGRLKTKEETKKKMSKVRKGRYTGPGKGYSWSKEKRKKNTGIKKWYINIYTKETKLFNINDFIDESIWKKGRKL